MSQIIVNANAPVVKITIDVDYRYNPPRRSLNCSQTMPGLVIQGELLLCAADLNGMMQREVAKQQPVAEIPPNLPPAPQSN